MITLALPQSSQSEHTNLTLQARVANYPRKRLGQFSNLRPGETKLFQYPWDHPNCANALLMLEQEAGGGVGPDRNVVAFNTLCPHMGQILPRRSFQGSLGVAGPCPWHWSTYDLTRYGMVVSGHAAQGLPQVLLELEGDDLYAIGVQGLIYGFHDLRRAPDSSNE